MTNPRVEELPPEIQKAFAKLEVAMAEYERRVLWLRVFYFFSGFLTAWWLK